MSLALLLGSVNAALRRRAPSAPAAARRRAGAGTAPGAGLARPRPGGRFTGRWSSPVRRSTAAGWTARCTRWTWPAGRLRWSSRLGGPHRRRRAACSGDTVYAASSPPRGQGLRARCPTPATGSGARRPGRSSAPLALIDSILVAETQRGEVLGLDAGSGHDPLAPDGRRRPDSGRCRRQRHADRGHRRFPLPAAARRRQGRSPARPRPAPRVALARAPGRCWWPAPTDSLVVAVDPDSLADSLARPLDAPVLSVARAHRVTRCSPPAAAARLPHRARARRPGPTRMAELDWPVTAPGDHGGRPDPAGRRRRDASRAPTRRERGLAATARAGRSSSALVLLDDGMLAVGGDGDLHRYRR